MKNETISNSNTDAPPETPRDKGAGQYGEIVSFLLKEGFLTTEKLAYADRVGSKLVTPKPLLEVLKELGYVTEKEIRKAIQMNRVSLRIGDLLMELGLITKMELNSAFAALKKEEKKRKLGEMLVHMHLVDEREMIEILALQLDLKVLEPEFMEIDPDLFLKGQAKLYRQLNFIPIALEEGKTLVAFQDPMDAEAIRAANNIFGENIVPAISRKGSIENTLKRMESEITAGKHAAHEDDDSVVGIVDGIITDAIRKGVSDIHIEPMRDRLRIRYRLDGVLVHHRDFPLQLAPMITSRIKILSKADIAEKRRHQGGRITFSFMDREIDLRISFFVTIHGEKTVIRILNQLGGILDISEIGMAPRMLDTFVNDVLESPTGIMIITGPTGSGKTTTVYSCINHINRPENCIVTAEEPVEFVIDGISQCSINPRIDLTYEETLRHIVRQDPDVVVIGEIRDNYSAEVAVQTALTGHKVLTTFHTEDSIGGLIRLRNMDIDAFLISSTVVSVVAQRLLRKVCRICKRPYTPTPSEVRKLGYSTRDLRGAVFLKGKGCEACNFTGYKGRTAVFEMLVMNEQVKDAILNNNSNYHIRRISVETSGLVSLLEDAVTKAAMGLTTVEEILRIIPKTMPPRPLTELKRLLGE